MIHIKPVLSHIRYFSKGSYENREPYSAIATVQFINDNEVFISGLHGTISRKDLQEGIAELTLLGVTIIRYERHGKDKVITTEAKYELPSTSEGESPKYSDKPS